MINTAPQEYTDPAWNMDSKRDIVEVVRCKDCKWRKKAGSTGICYYFMETHECEPNDYCSHGERKSR